MISADQLSGCWALSRPGRHRSGLIRFWDHGQTPSEFHPITRPELASALRLLEAVNPHLTALDALFGLASGEDQSLPFEVLIQPDRFGSSGVGAGQNSADSLP